MKKMSSRDMYHGDKPRRWARDYAQPYGSFQGARTPERGNADFGGSMGMQGNFPGGMEPPTDRPRRKRRKRRTMIGG